MIIMVVKEVEIATGNWSRFIKFDLDDGKPFCYRSRRSINAFYNHKYKRNKNKKFFYGNRHEDEHNLDYGVWKKMMKEHSDLEDIYAKVPMIEVDNLWEFYKLIGYNHRRKKYADQ